MALAALTEASGPVDKDPGAFRTITEVAEALDVPQHVLRFWETRFGQIRPVKRAGGRRYYRPGDVALVAGIRHLLHVQRYTIEGAQRPGHVVPRRRRARDPGSRGVESRNLGS